MNIEQLQTCADVLGEMAANFSNLPRENTKALESGMYCLLAQSLVVEYTAHLGNGLEPFDAMEATVNGELKLPEAKTTLLTILTANPKR
jgi:hypothetical protein